MKCLLRLVTLYVTKAEVCVFRTHNLDFYCLIERDLIGNVLSYRKVGNILF